MSIYIGGVRLACAGSDGLQTPQTVRLVAAAPAGARGPQRARGSAARRRDAARLSVETRDPPALAARVAARPPRALVTRRSPQFALPTIVNYIPMTDSHV
ncbi:unnamed protein product [Arctia plantaginis]|uniref:Uncharacterized protein n=1 Tax=Arctia plantaginis TaxID=874455 RepID=A0A8S1AXE3_ARCPL|nr:unnamed protein product [Arctia plantaginis]CAB3250123.1 unnamed protein product [Arctia plantaginis]